MRGRTFSIVALVLSVSVAVSLTDLYKVQQGNLVVYTTPALQSLLESLVVPAFRSATGIDRKSTRLNSSHLVISYAVFCLKKKTQQHSPPPHPRLDDPQAKKTRNISSGQHHFATEQQAHHDHRGPKGCLGSNLGYI